jgi:hypothetical protein
VPHGGLQVDRHVGRAAVEAPQPLEQLGGLSAEHLLDVRKVVAEVLQLVLLRASTPPPPSFSYPTHLPTTQHKQQTFSPITCMAAWCRRCRFCKQGARGEQTAAQQGRAGACLDLVLQSLNAFAAPLAAGIRQRARNFTRWHSLLQFECFGIGSHQLVGQKICTTGAL